MLFQLIFGIERQLKKNKDPVELNIAQTSLEK